MARRARSDKYGNSSSYRAKFKSREPYRWLGAGAATLGVTLALATSPAVAHADDSTSSSSSAGGSSEGGSGSSSDSTRQDSTAGEASAGPNVESAGHSESGAASAVDDAPSPTTHTGRPDGDAELSPEPRSGTPKRSLTAERRAIRGEKVRASGFDLASGTQPTEAPLEQPRTRIAPTDSAQLTSPLTRSVVTQEISVSPQAGPGVIGDLRAGVIAAAYAPLAAPGSDTPVQSPAGWVLAAVARRELGDRDESAADAAGGSTTSSAPLAALGAVATANAAPAVTLTQQGAPNSKTGKVTGKVTATDPDGNKLTFTSPITTPKGTVTVTSKGAFTYTPTAAERHAAAAVNAPAAAKVDTFTITVSDGLGGIATVPISVTITPANVAPSAKVTVNKADPVTGKATGQVAVTDKDADSATFTASTPANGAVVVRPDGSFTYTPTAAARATARVTSSTDTDKFTITINDQHGGTKSVPVTVNIAPADTAPVNVIATVATPNASTGVVKGVVTARDDENDSLSFSGSATTPKGKVTVARDGTFTYTPTAAARHEASLAGAGPQAKIDTFTVNVADKYGATTAVRVTVSILGKNAAPTAGKVTVGKPNPVTGAVTGSIAAKDADKDSVTYTGSVTTSQGSVQVNANGTFTYTPTTAARAKAAAPGATSADKQFTFTVTANDGHGGVAAIGVNVAISPNVPPTNAKVTVGQPNSSTGVVTGTISATDPDGDKLTYSGPATTPKGTLTVSPQGTFTYTPTASARHAASTVGAGSGVTQDTFAIAVTDGKGAVTQVDVTVAILGTNTAPSVGNTTFSVNQNAQLTGNVLAGASDPDGDGLTVGFVSGRNSGTLNLNSNGSFTYTPNANFSGTDSFTYTVSDGHGSVVTATASITVNYVAPPQTGPTAADKVAAFVAKWKNRTVAGYSSPTVDPGQCVALIGQYVSEQYGITLTQLNAVRYADGQTNGAVLKAKGWQWSSGLAAASTIPDGAILVFGQNGAAQTGSAGHIGIWYSGAVFDQNDGWRSNGSLAGLTPYKHLAPALLGYWRPPGGTTVPGPGPGPGTPGGATSGTKNGTATVAVLVNVRNDPSTNGPIVAQYSPGQTFNYDSWVIANGFYWVSYVSYSGVRRYVAESTLNGSTVYLRGGVFH